MDFFTNPEQDLSYQEQAVSYSEQDLYHSDQPLSYPARSYTYATVFAAESLEKADWNLLHLSRAAARAALRAEIKDECKKHTLSCIETCLALMLMYSGWEVKEWRSWPVENKWELAWQAWRCAEIWAYHRDEPGKALHMCEYAQELADSILKDHEEIEKKRKESFMGRRKSESLLNLGELDELKEMLGHIGVLKEAVRLEKERKEREKEIKYGQAY